MTNATPSPRTACLHPLRTVLVGTSLGEESDRVVRAGLAVARAAGARVALVHAIPDESRFSALEIGRGEDFAAELSADAREALARQVERLGLLTSEIAFTEVVAGEPHRVLVESAQRAGADLIVVGATGAGPLAAELLGSTADRVLRKATCPVLLIRTELSIPPRRVLAPVDLSAISADAYRCGLDLLGQIAGAEKTEIRAVHAVSFFDALALKRQTQGDLSPEAAAQQHGEELRRFVRENPGDAPAEVTTAVLPGEARFEILRDLSEHPADLVLLGTHGRGGFDRLMLGSVASTVARKAPSNVLLISPDAALSESIGEAIVDRTAPV